MSAARSWARRRWIAGGLATLALGTGTLARAAMAEFERQRVERLLAAMARAEGVGFERNGRRVSGTDAARFLRAKWDRHGSGVATAESFIDQIATRSSTTGQAYRVCTADGACTEAAPWLRQRLREVDAAPR